MPLKGTIEKSTKITIPNIARSILNASPWAFTKCVYLGRGIIATLVIRTQNHLVLIGLVAKTKSIIINTKFCNIWGFWNGNVFLKYQNTHIDIGSIIFRMDELGQANQTIETIVEYWAG